MTDVEGHAPGYRAPVFASMLKPMLFWPGIPYKISVGLIMASMFALAICAMVSLAVSWRVLIVAVVLYLGVSLLVLGDHWRVSIILRSLSYPRCLE